jgi:hypothetical protein
MASKYLQKNAAKFVCEKCAFICSKKSNYTSHLLTQKHQNGIQMVQNGIHKMPKNAETFDCECGNTYKYKSGLYRHKKTCQKMPKNAEEGPMTSIMLKLLNQNAELQKIILEQSKETKVTNTNIINNTTNNFNLNVFLNEKCKDAITLKDFVDGLEVRLKDLEETAQLGYSEGVSKIFINGLNELEVNKRPIHCSDAKRETLYIKDNNEWKKEDDNKTELTKAIKTIGKKNMMQIFEWQKKHPEYNDPDSKENDKYQKMIMNAMSGSTTEEQENNMKKIIKNVSKNVVIDKEV